MKFSLERGQGYSIRSYREGSIEIIVEKGQPGLSEQEGSIRTFTSSLIVTPERLIEDWEPVTHDQLTRLHIEQVIEIKPELIVLGTGRTLVFPAPDITQACYALGIGIEIMDTGAACRTYNILASEGRRVAAALLMI